MIGVFAVVFAVAVVVVFGLIAHIKHRFIVYINQIAVSRGALI